MKTLREIDKLVVQLFAKQWHRLHADDALDGHELKDPGVYLLAYSKARLDGKPVNVGDVFYVGMSNAAGGVATRLKQFKRGIEINNLHSGATRFYREYASNRPFSKLRTGKRFYFAALTRSCVSNKAAAKADDLRIMGYVACLEYYAIAHVAGKTGLKPLLNKFGNAAKQV